MTRTVAIAEGTPVVICPLLDRPYAATVVRQFNPLYWVVVDGYGTERTVIVHDIRTHADYPHSSGMLHDCYACEAVCHCASADDTCVSDECAATVEAHEDADMHASEAAIEDALAAGDREAW